MEKWKSIQNYEGLYEVSDLGRVKRVASRVKTGIKHNDYKVVKEKVLKQNKKRNGYFTVDLSKENHVKTISVHRLVAIAFVDNPQGKEVVNHINCNKTDNRAENLEWCTNKENSQHASLNGLMHSPRAKKVRCKQLDMIFDSSYKAGEYINEKCFGNSKQVKSMASKIRSACIGLQKTAYGFTWENVV